MCYDWEEVGRIGVDAGLCWVGDPCYCVTPDADEHPAKDWKEFCSILHAGGFFKRGHQQFSYQKGHPGLGVTVRTGMGDGSYPVYIRRTENGEVAEVKVVFLQERQPWAEDDEEID
jgi:hypothetical protein